MTFDSFTPRTRKVLGSLLAVGLILVGALFIYAVLVSPAKAPYREALGQYKNVYNANVAFTNSGAAINAAKASDEQFKNNITNVNTALKQLKAETTALGKQDVLAEGEGKALYDAFSKKAQMYFTYNEAVIASIEMLRPVLSPCLSATTQATKASATAATMRGCAAKMEEAQKLPDTDYRNFATGLRDEFLALAENFEAQAKLNDSEGVDNSSEQNILKDRTVIFNKLAEDTDVRVKNQRASRAEVDITPEMRSLKDYLAKRSKLFSF